MTGPLVTGVACSFHVNGLRSRQVSGPVLYAAIGARLMGSTPALLTQVQDEEHRSFVGLCKDFGFDVTRVSRATSGVEWCGPAICGDGDVAHVNGEPEPILDAHSAIGWPGALIIANSNPAIARRWMNFRGQAFTAIDLFYGWIKFLPKTCWTCARDADLVTLTRQEAGMFKAHGSIPLRAGSIRITKCGPDGVYVEGHDEAVWLSAPIVRGVHCDIGAGDLLLGALATAAHASPPEARLQAVVAAYTAICPTLSLLLGSRDPDSFIDALMREAPWISHWR